MNDILLILASQKGDKQAFNDLISYYYPFVSKFLRKLTENEILSDDLTQETFLKMIKSIDTYSVYGTATFSTYLLTIAKRCYIDSLRKNSVEFVDIESVVISVDDYTFDYFQSLDFEEILARVSDLPHVQAEAIKLKYLEGLTLAEIAEKQKTQIKTIKSRIHSGMVTLRKIFK
ncbi:RNA polymerase sigma factor [Clostridium grantii]|uniref:RNA polymerase sigma-70 factor, ECF subfamily n=1 Tax=Clostridium grantii DSM 8605 TaxID=1121316 RepID=A0A1M5WXT0_9CLOT|nr:sigma-70 family RNA polymerase sigma factor [Clostridium grantii]SHH92310.1 RNA polymerase sigma-70 factor, ECF subfamily [Clostridium grantii DSM 8605]